MKNNYRMYQKYNQSKFPKHLASNKRDANGNIIYYESLNSEGNIIKHYQKFDNQNRKIYYEDSTGLINIINYYNESKIIKSENEKFIDEDNIKTLRISNYDTKGSIESKTIISGNSIYYQQYKHPYSRKTTYTPFEKV